MRVLIVNSYYFPDCNGGAEFCARTLAEQLHVNGISVDVLTTGLKTHQDTVNGIRVVYLYSRLRKWWWRKGIRKIIANFLFLFDFVNFFHYIRVINKNYDVVHTHAIEFFSPAVWIAARLCGIPVLHTKHDNYIKCPRLFLLRTDNSFCTKPKPVCRMRASFCKWIAEKCRVTFVSPSMDLARVLGLEAIVVPNGVKKLTAGNRCAGARTRFAFIGRLSKLKGIDFLIDVFKRLPENVGELHIAGDGELKSYVENNVGKASNIYYHGWITSEKKDAFFRDADVLICPSYSENLPYVILEAFNSGLPVIASNVGGIPEIVKHGKAGLLFQAGNKDELEACMMRMATERELYRTCCEGAKESAAEYTIEAMTEHYMRIYKELCKQ